MLLITCNDDYSDFDGNGDDEDDHNGDGDDFGVDLNWNINSWQQPSYLRKMQRTPYREHNHHSLLPQQYLHTMYRD